MEGLMDFISQHAGPTRPYDFNSTNEMIDVMDVFSTSDDAALKIESRQISACNLSMSLQNPCRPGQRTLITLILVPLITTLSPYHFDINENAFKHILKEFGLEILYKYAHATGMTFDIIPNASGSQDLHGLSYYSIFLEHYFGLYVSADPDTGSMRGIVWTSPRLMDLFRSAIINLQTLSRHPYYIMLAASAAFNADHNHYLGDIEFKVNTVEKRTGHQGWDMIAYPSAGGELSDLSAKMSGLATSLAANRRLNGMDDEILKVLSDTSHVPNSLEHGVCTSFETHRAILQRRSSIRHLHIELLMSRVQTQLTALFNLSSREEMKLSLELAKDSRTVATASQRDSSSMKALAAVTILFLPGTSIASLFSMSMFDWRAGEQAVSDRFWIYWAITIPLTVLTVSFWLIWDHRRTVLAQIRNQEALKGLVPDKV